MESCAGGLLLEVMLILLTHSTPPLPEAEWFCSSPNSPSVVTPDRQPTTPSTGTSPHPSGTETPRTHFGEGPRPHLSFLDRDPATGVARLGRRSNRCVWGDCRRSTLRGAFPGDTFLEHGVQVGMS